jgi:hypothetical protein
MTDEQYARLGARLIKAIQVWGDEAGMPKSSLAILLASAAGEIAAQENGGLAAGAALLRNVANTLEMRPVEERFRCFFICRAARYHRNSLTMNGFEWPGAGINM